MPMPMPTPSKARKQGSAKDETRRRGAIVTGGGRGIGRSIAGALLQQGVRVALADILAEELTRPVEELRRLPGATVLQVAASVTAPPKAEFMAGRVEAELGPLGILVNSAGTFDRWDGTRVTVLPGVIARGGR